MSNKSKEISANLNRIGLVLFILMALATLYYVYKTIVGGFNPFLWVMAWIVESIMHERYLPYTLSSTEWKNLGVSSFLPVMVAMSFTVGLTFVTAIAIGDTVFTQLKRKYIRKQLGGEFLARYGRFKKNRKSFNSDKEPSDVESARYKYYLEWRSFYKSSLTYSEWQDKILKSKYK